MAIVLISDPPYGVNIVSENGKVGGGKVCAAGTYRPIINDDSIKSSENMYRIMEGGIADKFIIFGGNYFTSFLPPSSCWIVWDKKGEMNSNNFADCEMIWTNFDKPARIITHLWRGMIKQGENGKRVHPTQKPVDLLVKIIEEYTKKDDIIVDPFLGSGSTLIACEKTKRVCYGSELEPLYIDVIISRYCKFAGVNKIIKNGKEIEWIIN